MLKKCMLGFIALQFVVKLVAMMIVLIMGDPNLPNIIFVLTGLLLACGLFFGIKTFVKPQTTKTKEYGIYYILMFVVTGLNLFFASRGTPAGVSLLESIVVGNLLDMLIALIFILLAFWRYKYIKIQ